MGTAVTSITVPFLEANPCLLTATRRPTARSGFRGSAPSFSRFFRPSSSSPPWRDNPRSPSTGLATAPLGQAQLVSSGNQLIVPNIGSSGLDGVSIDLGPSDGGGFDWLPLPPVPAVPESLSFNLTAVGTLGGAIQPLGSVGARALGTGVEITADFSPIGSSTVRLEVYSNGQFVQTAEGVPNGQLLIVPEMPSGCDKGPDRVPRPIPLPPIPQPPVPPVPWPPLPCYIWEWPVDIPIGLPGQGIVFGDELRILTENTSQPLQNVIALDLVIFNPGPPLDLTITDAYVNAYRGEFRGLGASQLAGNGNGGLVVSNIGSSGLDGVSIDIGESENQVGVEWLPLPPLPPGAGMRLEAFGTVGGATGELLGVNDLQYNGLGYQLFADYSSLGASSFNVEILDQGEVVAVIPNVIDPIGIPVQEPPHGCGKEFPWPNPPILCMYWEWPVPVQFDLPGMPPMFGDRIRLLADPGFAYDAYDRLTLRAFDIPLVEIVGRTNGVFLGNGRPASALGDANVKPEGSSGLTISNIGSSGLDGVSMPLPDVDLFRVDFGPLGTAQSVEPGAAITCNVEGRLQGDVVPRDLGGVTMVENGAGQIDVLADYSNIATNIRLRVIDEGIAVQELTLPASDLVVRMPRYPDSCGKEPVEIPFPWPLCIWIDPGQDQPIEIPALPRKAFVNADLIQILAENPIGPLENMTRWDLRFANMPFVVITATGDASPTGADPVVPNLTATRLNPAYPNPFNPRTNLSFELGRAGHVALRVYSLDGRLVNTLHDGPLAAGAHRLAWNGTDGHGLGVASGTYLVKLIAPGVQESRKLMLLK